ncbi:MAG TPA: DUF4157 domain-containing protein [Longimicrobium sp.]|jgi:hypothetical protein
MKTFSPRRPPADSAPAAPVRRTEADPPAPAAAPRAGRAASALALSPPSTARPSGYPRQIPLPSVHPAPEGDSSPELHRLVARLGPGAPLPPLARLAFAQASGRSADAVRVHDDRPSHQAAEELGSEAFTLGSHVVLGDPATARTPRDRLLAHEAAHALQQQPGPGRRAEDPEGEAESFAGLFAGEGAGREGGAEPFAGLLDGGGAGREGPLAALGTAPAGLARKVIAKVMVDLPQDHLLIIDIDDGDFVGGCVKAIVPHMGVKLIKKKVGQVFNIHIGFVTNAKGQFCIFFYESVSKICEMLCFASKQELEENLEKIKEWLKDLMEKVFEALKIVLLAVLITLLIYLIVEAIIAAFGLVLVFA